MYRVILLTYLNLSQSLYKIPIFFSPILLLGLGLSQIQRGHVKRTTLYHPRLFHNMSEVQGHSSQGSTFGQIVEKPQGLSGKSSP